MPENLEEVMARMRQTLDACSEQVDGATQSRLTQARHRALAELRAPGSASRWPLATAAVMAAVVAVAMLVPRDPVVAAPVAADTFAMLASEGDREMLESLDFYLLLSEVDDAP